MLTGRSEIMSTTIATVAATVSSVVGMTLTMVSLNRPCLSVQFFCLLSMTSIVWIKNPTRMTERYQSLLDINKRMLIDGH